METPNPGRPHALIRIYWFYRDGLAQMTLGRLLWKIIVIKLIILFAVLKLFFFPDFLATKFTTAQQRADYVMEQLTQSAQAIPTPYEENEYDRKP